MSEKIEIGRIVPGKVYRYTNDLPRGCKDALYRVEAFILDVPSYQMKVLVLALTGKDAGLLFCCTPNNFAQRYAPHEPEPVSVTEPMPQPLPHKEVDFTTRGLH